MDINKVIKNKTYNNLDGLLDVAESELLKLSRMDLEKKEEELLIRAFGQIHWVMENIRKAKKKGGL